MANDIDDIAVIGHCNQSTGEQRDAAVIAVMMIITICPFDRRIAMVDRCRTSWTAQKGSDGSGACTGGLGEAGVTSTRRFEITTRVLAECMLKF